MSSNFVIFLDLARKVRQQSDIIKLLGIILVTLTFFYNWIDVLTFHFLSVRIRYVILFYSIFVTFVIIVFINSTYWV